MNVDVFPREAEVVPGQHQVVSITITNTASIIGGYSIRILGADPGWVDMDVDEISLFPDEVRTVIATINPPQGLPSGTRRLAVQVRELTPPHDSSITELHLEVPERKALQLRTDPLSVTGGRSGSYSVIAENTGNTMITGHLAGADPEARLGFDFEPDWLQLAPGQHVVVDMKVHGRRHIIGNPAVRMLGLYVDEVDEPFFNNELRDKAPARDEKEALANATFVQRALLSRGALSLVGLLAAISVFAIVITIALSKLVGQSTADRNLALQVAEARNAAGSGGTAGIAGTALQLTSGQPEPGVSVSVYDSTDTSKPIATTATDAKGTYKFTQLAAGGYKLSYRGAGFVQVWYPAAADPADGSTVTLAAGQQKAGVNVTLGGVPATISGTVSGDDVAGATLYLESPTAGGTSAATPAATAPVSSTGQPTGNPLPNDGNAIVQTIPIGSDGTFDLTGVPSPSVYQLVVTKTGYAPATQRLNVGAGEDRGGVSISLRKGDGLISGTVSGPTGPLGGATITATSGQTSVNTVSLTDTTPGAFTLRSLPTPATFTVVASASGYATQTVSLTLTAGQQLTLVSITLGRSSGSLQGNVTVGGAPAAGVSVNVTDGQHSAQTETQSTGDVGSWSVTGLAVPGTYTITFTRADLAPQTVSASLDASGNVTPGSQGSRVDAAGRVQVTMQSATASVHGTVTQPGGTTVCTGTTDLGEATVTLNSGTTSYSVISASAPAAKCGQYRIDNLPPGTYTLTVTAGTGTTPSSRVFTLAAGDDVTRDVTLAPAASISGTVETAAGTGLPNYSVFLYTEAGYPDQVSRTAVTDTNGKFSFAGVEAGNYVIAVSPGADPTNATVTRRITVQPSKNTDVDIKVS